MPKKADVGNGHVSGNGTFQVSLFGKEVARDVPTHLKLDARKKNKIPQEYIDLLENAQLDRDEEIKQEMKAAGIKATNKICKIYVPKLYNALTKSEEPLTPDQARKQIIFDTVTYRHWWELGTVIQWLDKAAKDQVKSDSGKLGAKRKHEKEREARDKKINETIEKLSEDLVKKDVGLANADPATVQRVAKAGYDAVTKVDPNFHSNGGKASAAKRYGNAVLEVDDEIHVQLVQAYNRSLVKQPDGRYVGGYKIHIKHGKFEYAEPKILQVAQEPENKAESS